MDEIIKFLNDRKIEFDLGKIDNGIFIKNTKYIHNKQVISFKWNKESINKLLKQLKKNEVDLFEVSSGKYNALYNINNSNNQVLVVYGVKSHVQLPKLLLKYFRTNYNLYYINTVQNKIIKSSAGNYNTKFGYYSLMFEEYLSNNYEKIIVDIMNTVTPFINKEVDSVTIKNLNSDINKLFLMALFRNPKYVQEINDKSLFSKLFDGGYDTEYLAFSSEKMNTDFLKGYTPIPLVNQTNKGLITFKSLFSNLSINGGIQCMAMVIHPQFGIVLVPNTYYKKMIEERGKQTYLIINDEKSLLEQNLQMYYYAKKNNDDVIGKKEDLDDIFLSINNMVTY